MFSLVLLTAWLFISFVHKFPRQTRLRKHVQVPILLILFRPVCAIFFLQEQHTTFYIDYFNREGFTERNPLFSAFTAV